MANESKTNPKTGGNHRLSALDNFDNLWILLTHTRSSIYRARGIELRGHEVSSEQVGVLQAVLNLGQGATPAALSRVMLRQPHATSAILTRMEKDGLIRKVKDLQKKNMVRIALTKKSERIYHQLTRRESIRRIFSSLSREDRQRLASYLTTLQEKAWEEIERDSRPGFGRKRSPSEDTP
jgi:DNA-binding MarR family transcriptional regulator